MSYKRYGLVLFCLIAAAGSLVAAMDCPRGQKNDEIILSAVKNDFSKLEQMASVRPKLQINQAELDRLRSAARPGGTHERMWLILQVCVDAALTKVQPTGRVDRIDGKMLTDFSEAWLISGDRKYYDAAELLVRKALDDGHWGHHSVYPDMDLIAGHLLFACGVFYDWCYDDIPPELREELRQRMVLQCARMHAALRSDIWWVDDYLGNHSWVDLTGLAFASVSILDDSPGDRELLLGYLNDARNYLDFCLKLLGEDGASIEGAAYAGYGLVYLFKYVDLARDLFGVDYFASTENFRNADRYLIATMLPRDHWTRPSHQINIADSRSYHWHGPNCLFRKLAAEYQSGAAQWMADQCDAAAINSSQSTSLNLLWYDPSVKPVHPADCLAPLQFFDDVGIVVARTDWSGDESLMAFKCGPFIGHKAMKARGLEKEDGDWGGAHTHPDAGEVIIYAHGEWQIEDDGYVEKSTANHNTLLIDGKGQYGEGGVFTDYETTPPARAWPRIAGVDPGPEADRITADVTQAYPEELGLKKFIRKVLFIKPNAVVVLDAIELTEPRDLELRFWPASQDITEDTAPGRSFLAHGKFSTLRFEPLSIGSDAAADVQAAKKIGWHGETEMKKVFSLRQQGQVSWNAVSAFTWSAGDEPPPRVTVKKTKNGQVFEVNGKQFSFE